MNKVLRYIQTYLVIAFPLVIISMLWNGSTGLLQGLLTINMVLWFTILSFFLILLVIVPQARELTLKRIANIRDRDEREEYITGRASRITYISTLSLLLLLFFSSVFSINLKKFPDDQAIKGKRHTLSFGLNYEFLEKKNNDPKPGVITLFDTKDTAFSKSTILLILILWQLISFNYNARKEQIKGTK